MKTKCKYCLEKERVWGEGHLPIICAFPDKWNFHRVNSECGLLDIIRSEAERNCVFFDDIYTALIHTLEGVLYVSWYRNNRDTPDVYEVIDGVQVDGNNLLLKAPSFETVEKIAIEIVKKRNIERIKGKGY